MPRRHTIYPEKTQCLLESILGTDMAKIAHDYLLPWHDGVDIIAASGHGELIAEHCNMATALEAAAMFGYIGMAIAAMATNTIQKGQIDSCMIIAAANGHVDIITLMADHGAADWHRALLVACKNGHAGIVALALTHNPAIADSALEAACATERFDIVQLLLDHGGAHDAQFWNSGLRGACYRENHTLIQLMISHGATSCLHCKRTIKVHMSNAKKAAKKAAAVNHGNA